jgi:hypothetical protein
VEEKGKARGRRRGEQQRGTECESYSLQLLHFDLQGCNNEEVFNKLGTEFLGSAGSPRDVTYSSLLSGLDILVIF